MKVTDLIILLFISIVSASKLTDKLFKEKNHIVNGERNAYVCTAGVGMMAAGVIAYVLDNRDFTFESFSKINSGENSSFQIGKEDAMISKDHSNGKLPGISAAGGIVSFGACICKSFC